MKSYGRIGFEAASMNSLRWGPCLNRDAWERAGRAIEGEVLRRLLLATEAARRPHAREFEERYRLKLNEAIVTETRESMRHLGREVPQRFILQAVISAGSAAYTEARLQAVPLPNLSGG